MTQTDFWASCERAIVPLAGHELAYARAGAGRDVVLLHGTLTSLDDMMSGLGPALVETYRVTAFDRPGHGGSTRPAGNGSLRLQADLIVEGLERLGLDRPLLVGHSMGGALALTIAIRHPGAIAGVVALAPLVFSEPRLELLLFGPRGVPFMGSLAARSWLRATDALTLPLLWNAIFLPQRMTDGFASAMTFRELATPDEMVATGEDSMAVSADLLLNLSSYARCALPVRILAGSRDIVVNNRLQGGLLARLMPDCTYREIAGLGHMLHHFVPDRIRETLIEISGAAEGLGRDRHEEA